MVLGIVADVIATVRIMRTLWRKSVALSDRGVGLKLSPTG